MADFFNSLSEWIIAWLNAAANWIAGAFQWIGNAIGDFFEFIGAAFNAVLTLIGDFASFIFQIIQWIIDAIGYILGIVGQVLEIFRTIIDLIISVVGLMLTYIREAIELFFMILNSFNGAGVTPIPGMPRCISAPMESQTCALWYIFDYTLLADNTPGAYIVPLIVLMIDLAIAFYVIRSIYRFAKKFERVFG